MFVSLVWLVGQQWLTEEKLPDALQMSIIISQINHYPLQPLFYKDQSTLPPVATWCAILRPCAAIRAS
jgi:hypothetical protein